MDQALVELRILGHTDLRGPDDRTGSFVLRQPKRIALLAYLALTTIDGFCRRDQIIAVFWPELDQAHARTQLRKVLHALRSTIGPGALCIRGEEEVRLNQDHVWCDAVVFMRGIAEGRWTEALTLYRGDLLQGLFPGGVGQQFETWLEDQRSELREQGARAAWECSNRADLAGRRSEALALARRAVELDPDDEEGLRRLIAVLDRYGDRASALRLYAEWQSRMQAEYGAEPAPETRKLARKVQAHRQGESAETPASLTTLANRTAVTAAEASPAIRKRPWWQFVGPGAVVLILLVAGLGVIRSRNDRQLNAADTAAGSVLAVLPLRGLGGADDARIGEGLAEELATALAHIDRISVRSMARSRAALQDGSDAAEIGRRLGVTYLIDGSVRHDARRLRITVRLVRAADGVTIWAQLFDARHADGIAVEERIAAAVADSLRLRLPQPGGHHPSSQVPGPP
jgi:serine/threonine-protein kinase